MRINSIRARIVTGMLGFTLVMLSSTPNQAQAAETEGEFQPAQQERSVLRRLLRFDRDEEQYQAPSRWVILPSKLQLTDQERAALETELKESAIRVATAFEDIDFDSSNRVVLLPGKHILSDIVIKGTMWAPEPEWVRKVVGAHLELPNEPPTLIINKNVVLDGAFFSGGTLVINSTLKATNGTRIEGATIIAGNSLPKGAPLIVAAALDFKKAAPTVPPTVPLSGHTCTTTFKQNFFGCSENTQDHYALKVESKCQGDIHENTFDNCAVAIITAGGSHIYKNVIKNMFIGIIVDSGVPDLTGDNTFEPYPSVVVGVVNASSHTSAAYGNNKLWAVGNNWNVSSGPGAMVTIDDANFDPLKSWEIFGSYPGGAKAVVNINRSVNALSAYDPRTKADLIPPSCSLIR